jgi:hypothetical protein
MVFPRDQPPLHSDRTIAPQGNGPEADAFEARHTIDVDAPPAGEASAPVEKESAAP